MYGGVFYQGQAQISRNRRTNAKRMWFQNCWEFDTGVPHQGGNICHPIAIRLLLVFLVFYLPCNTNGRWRCYHAGTVRNTSMSSTTASLCFASLPCTNAALCFDRLSFRFGSLGTVSFSYVSFLLVRSVPLLIRARSTASAAGVKSQAACFAVFCFVSLHFLFRFLKLRFISYPCRFVSFFKKEA